MWKVYTLAIVVFIIIAFILQRTLFITLDNYWLQAIIVGLIGGTEAFICEGIKGKFNQRK